MASVRDTNLKLYKATANPGHFCQQTDVKLNPKYTSEKGDVK